MTKGKNKRQDSTLSALLEEKPKRGRPRHKVQRQSVYVALTPEQKGLLTSLAKQFTGLKRADIPDIAIITLSVRLEAVRRAVSDRQRELPEGITDFDSLYFLWDVPVPKDDAETKWTSVRLSPQQAVEFGRLQGTLNAIFGANRSEVFTLALTMLAKGLPPSTDWHSIPSIAEFDRTVRAHFL